MRDAGQLLADGVLHGRGSHVLAARRHQPFDPAFNQRDGGLRHHALNRFGDHFLGGGDIEVAVCEHAKGFLLDPDFDALGIDTPIGLPDRAERGGRACDAAARRLLGPGRASSVFSAPVRATMSSG